jgi:dGTPase
MEGFRHEAKEFLYQNLYLCEDLALGHRQAAEVVTDLFAAWMAEPTLLPPTYQGQIDQEGAPRVIADYIAGMTDHFVLETHRNLRKMVVPSRS